MESRVSHESTSSVHEERSTARTVLVTGAADGIGLAIASEFAEQGDKVAMVDNNASRLGDAVERLRRLGHSVGGFTADVSVADEVEQTVHAVVSSLGPIEVAISNAGIAPRSSVLEMTNEQWDEVIAVNLTGTFLVTRAAARSMVDNATPGRICCIASGAAQSGRLGAAHYCASKAGLVMFAKVLAMELGPHAITVNVVSPGLIDHGYREGLGYFVSSDYVRAMRNATPIQRAGTPADVAQAVKFLTSDAATYISGSVLSVDGASSVGRYEVPWPS